jgi:ATP-dependent protease ClpP protease subunit
LARGRGAPPQGVSVVSDEPRDGPAGHAGVEEWAEASKKSRQKMYQIYHNKMKIRNPNITIRQIEKMCAHDKIFSAEEGVALGLADSILKNVNELIGE